MANREFVGDLQPVQPRIPYLVRHKPVPGPGAYDLKSEIGERRSSSPRKNEPAFTIGKDKKDMPLNTLTKKCDFIAKPGIGHQSESQRPTTPSYGFGTSTRMSRELTGQFSPRPRSRSPRSVH